MENVITYSLAGVGTCVLAILIAYFFGKKNGSRKKILESKIITGDELEGFHYYYLPSASLTIVAEAKVILRKSAENGIVEDAKLQSVNCQASAKIEPDTSTVVALSYLPDFFFSDELKIVTNERGLLQNIESVSSDRIVKIVEQFTTAPDSNFEEEQSKQKSFFPESAMPIEASITEEVIFKNTFLVPQEHASGKEINCDWLIHVNGLSSIASLNASFTLTRSNYSKKALPKPDSVYNGIYTRPVVEVEWNLKAPGAQGSVKTSGEQQSLHSQPEIKMSCLIPDSSRIMKIPVERSLFVKTTSMPKFADGILLENYVSKPSGMEEFSKIPIHILKAIVSIPAQILQFKITRNNLDTEYQKSITDLLAAKEETRLSSEKSRQAQLISELDSLKKSVSELPERIPLSSLSSQLQPRVPKLGKQEPDAVQGVSNTEKTFKSNDAFIDTVLENTVLQDNPMTSGSSEKPADWSLALQAGYLSDYDNYRLKTCVPAAAAYLITIWSANTKNETVIPSLQTVIKAYQDVSHYNPADPKTDVGCKIYNFLRHWKEKGIGGDRIDRLSSLKTGNIAQLMSAVNWLGGCIIGLKMPASAKNQIIWDNPGGITTGEYTPNSWGGHAVAVIGYDAIYLIAISHGRKIHMTYSFFTTYTDESFAVLSSNNWLLNGMSPTEPGLDLAGLKSKMNIISNS